MPVLGNVVFSAVVLGTLLPVAAYYQRFGSFSWLQAGIVFFMALNTLIALWELCLFFKIRLIEKQAADFQKRYKGRELRRVLDLFTTTLSWDQVWKPDTWAEIWSSYSIFDESYANTKSFGWCIDIGNGFSTLLPSIAMLVGLTYHDAFQVNGEWSASWLAPIFEPFLFGSMMIVFNYQMWYGTVIYFTSYVVNKRYVGHSALNVAIFVGISNIIWVMFPLLGMFCGYRIAAERSFGILKQY
jgi:hypothetical protein